ncbi:potassium channel family protein [Halobium salinum]|uniref:Potassium channel family protein n=1 Tax=Halobium salinum TaxID=1364940 RepID=A0ABD5P9N0_9EURY|nr:TrkA C-terminal domain-containing protein [Halobium salinum]
MAGASLPVEILFGIYLGVLTGIVPALIAGTLGFVFKYFTDVSIPGFGVIVLALAVAGVNGGLLALADPEIVQSQHGVALVVAILVVLMLTLYAHAQGDKLGGGAPRRLTLKSLAERTLSTDVVELVGGRGQVRVTVAGEVGDVEGYPSLPADLRAAIREGEWTFPADVPLAELESRLADRLAEDHDLADVQVRLDERARATVHAAPPVGGFSKRVPSGKRAVSVEALLPSGLARDDEVRVVTDGGTVAGTVLSAKLAATSPGTGRDDGPTSAADDVATDGGVDEGESASTTGPADPAVEGGEGRVALAVDRRDAETLLAADGARLVVGARGTRREFELAALLRRAGNRFRRVSVREGGPLDGTTIGEASVRESYGVGVLAVKRGNGRWRFDPHGSTELGAADELFVVGPRDALEALSEVAA